MKQLFKPLLTALLLLCSTVINAHDFEVDGIYYNITDYTNKTVEVTYRGYYSSSYIDRYSGSITIPESVKNNYNGVTYTVTSIGGSAFSDCSRLTSIEIPNSVTSIGSSAFSGCSRLTSIEIPNSVTSIGSSAFSGCSNLTSITIPNSVTNIGSSAFSDCSSLTSIEIPNSVTSIGRSAFFNCSGLTSIEIPSSVTSIGISAFSDCSGLTSIKIPSSVTSIGSWAFNGCTNLKKIKIPGNVKSIGNDAFDKCWHLNHIIFEAGNDTLNVGHIYSTHDGLFEQCNIDTLILNRNIKFNSEYTLFYDNKAGERLKFVEIGDNVTYIPDNLFYNCPNIINFKIGKNLTFIGKNGFHSCSGLKKVKIGHLETSRCTIGEYAFANCKDLEIVHICNAVIELGAFFNCISLHKLSLNDEVTTIERYAFYECTSLEKINIGNGVRVIEDFAFYKCTGLKEIILGERLNYIGNSVFGECENIDTIYALPTRAINCYESNPKNTFSDKTYKYATLLVKEEAIDSYDASEPWSRFYIDAMKDFTITYIVDGEIYKKEKYKLNDRITPLNTPTKEGYTFSGWSEIPETMPANDVIIEGSFFINSYTVTYKVDGEIYATDSIKYGATIEPIAEPTKKGHTFSGWSEIPETMPANDVVIDGSFSINTYNITYKVDGEIYATDSIKYGATIEPIEAPTKEGYTFSGWSEIPETMPANDVVIEGTFSINTYNITYKVDGEIYATDIIKFGATIEPIAEPTKEGHTFSGWSEIPETMPANDVVVEGSFSINTYNITYKVDGEIYATDSIKYGAIIEPIAEPTKEGHTFSGWSEIPETMPANDVVIEGTFSVNSYMLTYKVDGEVYATDSIKYGAAIEPIEAPTKEGHTFSGWSEIPETMPANDVVVEGSFSINSYTITYKVDGEVYETMTVKYGAKIEPIAEPTKEGYTFSGWKDIPETMPAKDIVVEGSFIINSYTLTYKVDGAVYKTEIVVYGTAITPIAEPTKEGHTFSGWSEIPETMPANDVVVEGTFSVNSYTLTYKVDGAVYKTETIAYGATITPIAEPTKEGYTFSGWKDIPETMPAKDIVVEGSFTINSYTLTYKVDGAVYKTEPVVYGTAITPIAEPTKEGHTFSGWSEIPETMPAKDVVVEGTFSINSYILTYKVDGAVYKTETIAYGATITPIAEPTKEGYTFSGWKDIPATMPAEDVVVEGSFTINSYTLTYKVDGAVYKTETVVYGTAITPIAAPTKEGHTFSGWSEIPETMPAKDVVVEGSFSVNSYTVTFMVDGEIYETMTVEYGAEIELPTPPEKEGYIFSGWIDVPATMPAEDIVIEGRFEVDTTGINAVTLDLEKNEVYNLKGQRITESENLTRGIYIVNGKKIFIK